MNNIIGRKLVVVAISIVMLLIVAIATLKTYKFGCVVRSEEDAISIAREAIVKTFGEDEEERAFQAKYNVWNGTWRVYVLPSDKIVGEMSEAIVMVGGTPEVIISAKTGEVIRILHGK